MTDEVIPTKPEVKPKAKKKKKDFLDVFIKEYKNDRNDLRILIYLSKMTGLDYRKIELKKHELLKLLINDYANRKNAAKAKEIKAYIKSNFNDSVVSSINTASDDTNSEKDLIMKDIKRAFGDPEEEGSVANKILIDILNFPDAMYNCSYNPDFLVKKLYEFYGKSKSRQIHFRNTHCMAELGKATSSNWWNASLSSDVATKKIEVRS